MTERSFNKITIIGAGAVGSTTAYTLMISGLVSEIVLIDANVDKAEGEVMDLNHGMPFVSPKKIYCGDYPDCQGSDIIIITAGASQKPGETRIDLINRNAAIFKEILTEIIKYNKDCILLVVTNPVDILTYLTYKISGFPKNRVIGSGTVLDTARLRFSLGDYLNLDTRNIHGYIIGEHGDTEVPTWSTTNIASIPMDEYRSKDNETLSDTQRDKIFKSVKNAAYDIIERKGATYYAVALAIRRIVEAMVRNENSVLTVSSLIDGEYGLKDVCLSLPSIVNSQGVSRIVNLPLNEEEHSALVNSSNSLKDVIAELNI